MDLMIVESPAKAKKIKSMFPQLNVLATVGHFRDLPVNAMGVEPPEFKPVYAFDDKKKKVVSKLRSAAKEANNIFIASDPDREGEAIAMHIAQTLGRQHKDKLRRVTYTEVNKSAISKAISNSGSINQPLVKAQEARRVIDRFVGYLVSPCLTRKLGKKNLSAGRVQCAGLKLVCLRHNEIHAFDPVTYYTVTAELGSEGVLWEAEWDYKNHSLVKNSENGLCTDLSLAQAVENTKSVKVLSNDFKDQSVAAPPPLTTSSMLKAAAKELKLSAKHTMKCAQALFEAGAITYHRTDSPVIDPDFVSTIREYASEHGYPIPKSPAIRKAKAGAQEAHEAVRVTSISDAVGKFSPADDKTRLYKLIWLRTLQSQLAPGIDSQNTIKLVGDNGHEFVARGKQVKIEGWRCVGVIDENTSGQSQNLPAVVVDETIDVLGMKLKTRQTKPPKLFTEITLIEELEKREIGRPSTYASIIQTLLDRNYVNVIKGKFNPSELGIQVR